MKNKLVENFIKISKIYRESGNESLIADFFVNIAKENNYFYFKDQYNNVLIKKPGNVVGKPVALQSHLDMVCACEENFIYDFKQNGIDVVIDGDKVYARGTSLGADQGVGLTFILAILEDKELVHPDLEIMLTSEEETTFNGVDHFPYDKMNSKRIINIDNSSDTSIMIGSDADIYNRYSMKYELLENMEPCYKITLKIANGGNAGMNIECSKDNAIYTCLKCLKNSDIKIASINGGTNEVNIATKCEVVLSRKEDIYELFENYDADIEMVEESKTLSTEDTKKLIETILNFESGYIDKDITANLGKIEMHDNTLIIDYLIRSLDEAKLNELNKRLMNAASMFHIEEVYRDSSWKSDKNSELVDKYCKLYFEKFNENPQLEICHGGCECSTINGKIENVDMISIGANMEGFHTPKEVTYISSWIKMYELLTELLKIL